MKESNELERGARKGKRNTVRFVEEVEYVYM